MKALVQTIIVLLLVAAPVFAQTQDTTGVVSDGAIIKEQARWNSIFIEFGGNLGLVSANYERTITHHLALRAGVMWLPPANVIAGAHAAASFLLFEGPDKLECGVGYSVSLLPVPSIGSGSYLPITLGYRYQPVTGGVHFRAGMTMLCLLEWTSLEIIGGPPRCTPEPRQPNTLQPWFHLSIGWNF